MRTFTLGLMMAICVAGTAEAQQVGGAYTVSGTNFNGSSYGGTAQIAPSGAALPHCLADRVDHVGGNLHAGRQILRRRLQARQ